MLIFFASDVNVGLEAMTFAAHRVDHHIVRLAGHGNPARCLEFMSDQAGPDIQAQRVSPSHSTGSKVGRGEFDTGGSNWP